MGALNGASDPEKGVANVSEAFGLLDEEGLHLPSYRKLLCNYAYIWSRTLGDVSQAKQWLATAYEYSRVAHGQNHWATCQIRGQIYETETRPAKQVTANNQSYSSIWITILAALVVVALAVA